MDIPPCASPSHAASSPDGAAETRTKDTYRIANRLGCADVLRHSMKVQYGKSRTGGASRVHRRSGAVLLTELAGHLAMGALGQVHLQVLRRGLASQQTTAAGFRSEQRPALRSESKSQKLVGSPFIC